MQINITTKVSRYYDEYFSVALMIYLHKILKDLIFAFQIFIFFFFKLYYIKTIPY